MTTTKITPFDHAAEQAERERFEAEMQALRAAEDRRQRELATAELELLLGELPAVEREDRSREKELLAEIEATKKELENSPAVRLARLQNEQRIRSMIGNCGKPLSRLRATIQRLRERLAQPPLEGER